MGEQVTKIENIGTYVGSAVDGIFPFGNNRVVKDMVTYEYAYPLSTDRTANIQGLVGIRTDAYFMVPSVMFAKLLTKASDQTNVYLYLFDHFPKLKNPNSPVRGTNHAVDLAYIFDMTQNFLNDPKFGFYDIPTPSLEPVFDVFAGSLSAFAKTGDPSRVGLSGQLINWPRFEPGQENYQAIADQPEVRSKLADKRYQLWAEFLPKMTKYN